MILGGGLRMSRAVNELEKFLLKDSNVILSSIFFSSEPSANSIFLTATSTSIINPLLHLLKNVDKIPLLNKSQVRDGSNIFSTIHQTSQILGGILFFFVLL